MSEISFDQQPGRTPPTGVGVSSDLGGGVGEGAWVFRPSIVGLPSTDEPTWLLCEAQQYEIHQAIVRTREKLGLWEPEKKTQPEMKLWQQPWEDMTE